jgi:hypothetical protein
LTPLELGVALEGARRPSFENAYYARVRSRRREPIEAFPVREIETRLARLKKARAG